MENLVDDDKPLRGVAAIAKFRDEPPHRTYRGLELGHIPGYKEGGIWHLRPSTQRAHIQRLEEQRRAQVEAAEAAFARRIGRRRK